MNIGLWRALVWQNTPQHSIGVGLPFWLWWTRYSQIKGSLCVSDQAVQWTNSLASAYKKPCTDRIANRFQNISTQGLWEYFLGPTFALIKRVGNFENKFFAWNSAIRFPSRLKKESLISVHGSCDNSFKKNRWHDSLWFCLKAPYTWIPPNIHGATSHTQAFRVSCLHRVDRGPHRASAAGSGSSCQSWTTH